MLLVDSCVPCGFPSPALDYIEDDIDLQRLLAPRPSSTFLVRAKGDSMTGAGIFDGAILVIDRSLRAEHNDIVLAVIHGEFTVKYLHIKNGEHWLMPAHHSYRPIQIDVIEGVMLWGVITWFINKSAHRNKKRLNA